MLQGLLVIVVGFLMIPPMIAIYRVFNDMPGRIASPRVMRVYYGLAWLAVIARLAMLVSGGHDVVAFVLPLASIGLMCMCEHDWNKKPVVLDRQQWK